MTHVVAAADLSPLDAAVEEYLMFRGYFEVGHGSKPAAWGWVSAREAPVELVRTLFAKRNS